MPKKNLTTKKHFELFQEECGKWIKIFGLNNWEIFYRHFDDEDECRGACYRNLNGMVATITLSKDWETDIITDRQVAKVAFHEVCELLLSRLELNASSRFVTADEIEQSKHEIIRVLENVVFEASEEE